MIRDCEHGRQVGKCADCDVAEWRGSSTATPDYSDSWRDIAGYAALVADRLDGVSR